MIVIHGFSLLGLNSILYGATTPPVVRRGGGRGSEDDEAQLDTNYILEKKDR